MIQLKQFRVQVLVGLIFVGTASAQTPTSDLKFLKTLESCQQRQYTNLLKTHSTLSELAATSSMEADVSQKLRDKLRSMKRYTKAREAMAKEMKYRSRQSALLSLDSSILAMINEVLTDKTKVAEYKKKLLAKAKFRNQSQMDEIVAAVEQLDLNYSEYSGRAFSLKIKDDREFQSCAEPVPQLQASL